MNIIADFEFVRPLGSGGHGQVFLAVRPPRLPVEAETVAVKVLTGESTAETFRHATRELSAWAGLGSPYLVPLHDAGQHDGVFYYSMAYVEGGSLASPAEPRSLAAGLAAVADAARGVATLHEAGLVHGAITPNNVLLGPGGAMLADPDLTEIFTPGLIAPAAGSPGAIQCGDPRRLLGEPSAQHHDVWSLGVLVCRAITGAEEATTDVLRALRRVIAAPPGVPAALSGELAALVTACFSPPPDRPSAATVAERLADEADAAPSVAP